MARTGKVIAARKGFTRSVWTATGTRQNILPEERIDRIRRKAYELFEKRGHISGNDLADWFEAEKAVDGEIKRRQF